MVLYDVVLYSIVGHSQEKPIFRRCSQAENVKTSRKSAINRRTIENFLDLSPPFSSKLENIYYNVRQVLYRYKERK
jgi:hypothetical protein